MNLRRVAASCTLVAATLAALASSPAQPTSRGLFAERGARFILSDLTPSEQRWFIARLPKEANGAVTDGGHALSAMVGAGVIGCIPGVDEFASTGECTRALAPTPQLTLTLQRADGGVLNDTSMALFDCAVGADCETRLGVRVGRATGELRSVSVALTVSAQAQSAWLDATPLADGTLSLTVP